MIRCPGPALRTVVRHVGCFALVIACAQPDARAAARPNIILVMADDLGWGDPRCFNAASPIQTPELDEMAQRGIKLTRFYAAAPVCSPTRGSCLTGRHPSRYGIWTANSGHLPANETTLAEVLAEQGYATGHFGKWHLGTLARDYSGKGPQRRPDLNFSTPGMCGFAEWFSTEFAVATWDPYDPAHSHLSPDQPYDTRALYWHNGVNVVEPLVGCDSQLIMSQALDFLRSANSAGQPVFMVIWFHAPHQPVVGGRDDLALYAEYPEDQRHYYAVVTAMDRQIGRLRAELRHLCIDQNTLIWFCSDNGPEGNPLPKGRSQGSAGPFRGRKRSLYEGGVRVPGIVEWPAVVSVSRESDVPCVTSDFWPTVLAMLRIADHAPQQSYDGVSLLPLLRGEIWERPRPIGFQFGEQASWVGNRYKLVHNTAQRRLRSDNGTTPVAEFELYDLVDDPTETTDLASRLPDVVDAYRQQLDLWQASCRRE